MSNVFVCYLGHEGDGEFSADNKVAFASLVWVAVSFLRVPVNQRGHVVFAHVFFVRTRSMHGTLRASFRW